MFKKIFTEARGSRGSALKPSRPQTIKDMLTNIKGEKHEDIINTYNELDKGYLSEFAWEKLVNPGEYVDYYNDAEKAGLIKKVKTTFQKALKKAGIDYDVEDCKNKFIKTAYDKNGIQEDIIYETFKLKKAGYREFNNYRDAESFEKELRITESFLRHLRGYNSKDICSLANSGIGSISYKKVDNKESISASSRTSAWTEEYIVTITEYGTKNKFVFNVSKTTVDRI